MTTEDKPHVVYEPDPSRATAFVCPSYAAAYAVWKSLHTYQRPYLIATLGRVIDPSTPIVDVNE